MRTCWPSVTTYLPGEWHILLPRAFHNNPQSENSVENFGGAYHANALYQGAEIEENRKIQKTSISLQPTSGIPSRADKVGTAPSARRLEPLQDQTVEVVHP